MAYYDDFAADLLRTRGKNVPPVSVTGMNITTSSWWHDLARETVRTRGTRALQCCPAFWSDPSDTTRQTWRYAAKFSGGSSANYLSVAHHTDFDFSGGAFTIAFSKNTTVDPGYTLDPGAKRTFISKNRDTAGGGGIAILAGTGSGQEQRVGIFVATNSDGDHWASRYTDSDTYQWSRCVITFNAGVVLIYLDGVEWTTTGGSYVDDGGTTATMPTAPLNPTAIPFSIGREGHTAYIDAIDAIHDVRIYKSRVLRAIDVKEDWNGGQVQHYGELPSGLQRGCTTAYDLNNALTDPVAAHTLTATGTVPFVPLVIRHEAKGVYQATQYPCGATVAKQSQPCYGHAPRYHATGINSLPAFEFKANHHLYSAFDFPFNAATCDMLDVVQVVDTPVAEMFLQASADESSTSYYWATFLTPTDLGGGTKLYPTLRCKNDNVGILDNHIYADTEIVVGSPFVINWRCTGSGGIASFVCRVNGVAAGLTYGGTTLYNSGPKDCGTGGGTNQRDNICLGVLVRSDGATRGPMDVLMGDQLTYAPALSLTDNLAIETWLGAKYGIF